MMLFSKGFASLRQSFRPRALGGPCILVSAPILATSENGLVNLNKKRARGGGIPLQLHVKFFTQEGSCILFRASCGITVCLYCLGARIRWATGTSIEADRSSLMNPFQ